jgi:hypothetical protein
MIYYVLNTLAHILGSSFDVTQVDLPSTEPSTENPHITIKCSAGRSDSKRDIVQDNDIVHMEILFLAHHRIVK